MRSRTTAVTSISPTVRALERYAWRGGGPPFGYPVQVPRSAPRFRYLFRPTPFSQGNRVSFVARVRARHARRGPSALCSDENLSTTTRTEMTCHEDSPETPFCLEAQ